ncbi:MAG: pimeloyl-CoA dehydrogenase large subunit [Betaproteobacteria bacterium]|nr:pimeloyl-CoA dehydrogenase large subunit [Betaproteobacteria bacterium]
MDLQFSPEQEHFRQEVRAFVASHLPESIRWKVNNGLAIARDDYISWQKLLHAKGWAGVSWPTEFGGTGWDPVRQFIFDEEHAAAGGPRLLSFGLKMVGPVIMAFGSPEQQARYLPKILSADEWWCQGYSEPGAGSDLASLKTRALRDGDYYVVNGQKTWTTLGHYADWMFCLVRTDAQANKPQQGISFLLIDMNEVFFDNVRVPTSNRIGEENRGWTYAKYLLGHERINIAGVGISKRELARLKRIASRETRQGKPLLQDPLFAAKLARLEAELMALEITNLRVLAAEAEKRSPGPEASILKIKGSEIQQALTELMMLAVGSAAIPFQPDWVNAGWQAQAPVASWAIPLGAAYLNMRKTTIYGGSNEIQRNIISQMVLGL